MGLEKLSDSEDWARRDVLRQIMQPLGRFRMMSFLGRVHVKHVLCFVFL